MDVYRYVHVSRLIYIAGRRLGHGADHEALRGQAAESVLQAKAAVKIGQLVSLFCILFFIFYKAVFQFFYFHRTSYFALHRQVKAVSFCFYLLSDSRFQIFRIFYLHIYQVAAFLFSISCWRMLLLE